MTHVLVHEPTSRWTAELQRHFRRTANVSIRWVPCGDELLMDRAREAENCLFVIVAKADEAALERLHQLDSRLPNAAIIVLADDPPVNWEWQARELGADVLLPDTVEKRRVTTAVECLLTAS